MLFLQALEDLFDADWTNAVDHHTERTGFVMLAQEYQCSLKPLVLHPRGRD